MATFGWIMLIVVGAYLVFNAALIFTLTALRGGLESIPAALLISAIAAGAWVVVIFGISPFEITFWN